MLPNMLPFNIDLLLPTKKDLTTLKQITALDIFDGQSRNFHSSGLFSVDIFGQVGTEIRNHTYAYIDLKLEILHPILHKAICDLKAFYGEILASRSYATYNATINDFELSDAVNGQTGYSFFIKHLPTLVFEPRPSQKREFNIKLMTKYIAQPCYSKLIVMPAGIRDYEIDDNGKPSEDDINKLYRQVFAVCNIIDEHMLRDNIAYFDISRYNLQLRINALYEYIKAILEGKNKLIQGKWAKRAIFNGTRNVITSHVPTIVGLKDPRIVSCNQTVIGLYQFINSIKPLAVNLIRNRFLNDIFIGPNSPAMLVNSKTLHKEAVNIDHSYYDDWMLFAGIEKQLDKYSQENIRHDPVMVGDYYIGLMYLGPDKTFRFMHDIDELPKDRSAKDVHPITTTELLYLSIYDIANNTPGLMTRYPISGLGGLQPTYAYLATTLKSEIRIELDEQWQLTDHIAIEYPVIGSGFFGTLAPHISRLERYSADFDGDAVNYTSVLTDDAKTEIATLLHSRAYYVDTSGKMAFNSSNATLDLVVSCMTN